MIEILILTCVSIGCAYIFIKKVLLLGVIDEVETPLEDFDIEDE
jgi:hypothetical protein